MNSTSEARRLIEQGGFKINDEAVKDVKATITPESGMIIRAGKKKIVKVKQNQESDGGMKIYHGK